MTFAPIDQLIGGRIADRLVVLSAATLSLTFECSPEDTSDPMPGTDLSIWWGILIPTVSAAQPRSADLFHNFGHHDRWVAPCATYPHA